VVDYTTFQSHIHSVIFVPKITGIQQLLLKLSLVVGWYPFLKQSVYIKIGSVCPSVCATVSASINPLPSDRLHCCDRYIRCQRSLAVNPLNSRPAMYIALQLRDGDDS